MTGPIDVRVPGPNDPARDVLSAVRARLIGDRELPLRDVRRLKGLGRSRPYRLWRPDAG